MLHLPGLPIYWTPFNIFDLNQAKTFEALFSVAHSILLRMPQPVSMVCGPISSGGRGSKEENLKVFKRTIKELSDEGIMIFSQMPFEEPIWRIQKTDYYKGNYHTLEAFYLPIFESGLVKRFYFIPGWRLSFGASWEHKQAKKLGIEIVFL